MVLVLDPLRSAQASGSRGGDTFSHNRFGSYVRNRTIPVNPNTDLQVAIRSAMTEATLAWYDLLEEPQRDAWRIYAAGLPWQNKVGQVVYLTGHQHYCRSNVPRLQAALARVDDGPVVIALPYKDDAFAAAADESDQTIDVTFDDTLPHYDLDGAATIILMGLPQLASREFFNGPWRLLGSIPGSVGTPPTSPVEFATLPFVVGAGQKIWLQARTSFADGRLSEPFFCTTVVTE